MFGNRNWSFVERSWTEFHLSFFPELQKFVRNFKKMTVHRDCIASNCEIEETRVGKHMEGTVGDNLSYCYSKFSEGLRNTRKYLNQDRGILANFRIEYFPYIALEMYRYRNLLVIQVNSLGTALKETGNFSPIYLSQLTSWRRGGGGFLKMSPHSVVKWLASCFILRGPGLKSRPEDQKCWLSFSLCHSVPACKLRDSTSK